MSGIDCGDTNLGGPFICRRVGGPGKPGAGLRTADRRAADEERAEGPPPLRPRGAMRIYPGDGMRCGPPAVRTGLRRGITERR